ncbi:Hypothetical protein PENO1_042210 [Penicillium occitanis (nom. inval.)]|nr:Hypothetical protein PENO1_042210 [Penicillium occitanis (nom. inval.)]
MQSNIRDDPGELLGEADYHNLTGVPKWIGNYPVGHHGTYDDVNGGAFGVAAVNWVTWIFKDNTTAAEFFTEGGAEKAEWSETESFDLKDLLKY